MARPEALGGTAELGSRLRELREERRLTQSELGRALGVAVSSISSWEGGVKIPTMRRLADYATYFAADADARLPELDSLSAEQRSERNRLKRELERLRAAGKDPVPAGSGALDFWRFRDEGPVRIVTGELSAESMSPAASVEQLNYVGLTAHSDLDAAVELFGHVRALNPGSDVGIQLARKLADDDLRAHLVFLGSGLINPWVGALTAEWPVRQVGDDSVPDGEVFELAGEPPRRLKPVFRHGLLIEDVGMLVRIPNPNNIRRTLTICSGVFTRGGFGAVRSLTDPKIRARNHEYVTGRFGEAANFGLLMRVPVINHATGTPDLQNPATRLHEWHPAT
ncbi:helix-turn-helix domain-containing protein [Saccharopolyspora griseoalba]|uniref:Helix-turn-helix domain-containing protein n=1 Tax=Saccharopolyspora griseoalba TaxID=1431848 RepID=A0ABW2LNQ1_9PSEU